MSSVVAENLYVIPSFFLYGNFLLLTFAQFIAKISLWNQTAHFLARVCSFVTIEIGAKSKLLDPVYSLPSLPSRSKTLSYRKLPKLSWSDGAPCLLRSRHLHWTRYKVRLTLHEKRVSLAFRNPGNTKTGSQLTVPGISRVIARLAACGFAFKRSFFVEQNGRQANRCFVFNLLCIDKEDRATECMRRVRKSVL